jgi:DNA-binding response OmpR family regulator
MARRLRHLEPLTVAGIQYDPARRTATRGGRVLPLTLKESQLLQALLENGGYLTADELLELVWPEDRSRSVVKATVHTLRQKLGKPDAVHSAPGLGYRIGEAL